MLRRLGESETLELDAIVHELVSPWLPAYNCFAPCFVQVKQRHRIRAWLFRTCQGEGKGVGQPVFLFACLPRAKIFVKQYLLALPVGLSLALVTRLK